MNRSSYLLVPAVMASLLLPSPAVADFFSFNLDVHGYGSKRVKYGKIEADVERLKADLYYRGDDWELVVRYKVEVEDAPVGYCELILDLVDRDYPAAPIRLVVPLDRPTEYDDDEIEYEGTTATLIAREHIRDPGRLKLYGYAAIREGGPILDRKSTSVRFRR